MKLYAHVELDGSIHGLIALPEGEVTAMLTPDQGVTVCEIKDHGIKGEEINLNELEHLLKENSVEITPAKGKLVRRKK